MRQITATARLHIESRRLLHLLSCPVSPSSPSSPSLATMNVFNGNLDPDLDPDHVPYTPDTMPVYPVYHTHIPYPSNLRLRLHHLLPSQLFTILPIPSPSPPVHRIASPLPKPKSIRIQITHTHQEKGGRCTHKHDLDGHRTQNTHTHTHTHTHTLSISVASVGWETWMRYLDSSFMLAFSFSLLSVLYAMIRGRRATCSSWRVLVMVSCGQ